MSLQLLLLTTTIRAVDHHPFRPLVCYLRHVQCWIHVEEVYGFECKQAMFDRHDGIVLCPCDVIDAPGDPACDVGVADCFVAGNEGKDGVFGRLSGFWHAVPVH